MSEEALKQMQQELRELRDLMRGKGADGGFIHATLRLAELMHGTKENPGGMVKRIEEVCAEAEARSKSVETAVSARCSALENGIAKINRIIYMGAGAAFVINIGWMIFTHFHK